MIARDYTVTLILSNISICYHAPWPATYIVPGIYQLKESVSYSTYLYCTVQGVPPVYYRDCCVATLLK